MPTTSPDSSAWPAERTAALLDLWRQGLTSTAIAARLGGSRSAVLGRLHRLGQTRETKPPPKCPRAARRPSSPTASGAAVPSAPARPPAQPPALLPPRPGRPARSAASVPFLKRRYGQCGFPLWHDNERELERKFVCGKPSDAGASYCAECRRFVTGPGGRL